MAACTAGSGVNSGPSTGRQQEQQHPEHDADDDCPSAP